MSFTSAATIEIPNRLTGAVPTGRELNRIMPRISEVLRQSAAEGRWDLEAQRAAVWADLAPRLWDACCSAYQAIDVRRQSYGEDRLKEARRLCWDVTEAVCRATGLKPPRGVPFLTTAGLAPEETARAAAEADALFDRVRQQAIEQEQANKATTRKRKRA